MQNTGNPGSQLPFAAIWMNGQFNTKTDIVPKRYLGYI